MRQKTINDKAQEIQDYFFARGASVSRQDWEWLLTTLTNVQEEINRRLAFQKKVLKSEYEGGYTHALEDIKEYLDTLLLLKN